MATTGNAGMIGPKLGEGREAEAYLWGADAVLKLYRPGFGEHHAESVALQALQGQSVAPGLIDLIEHDGRIGVVLQRVDDTDMLTLLQQKPFLVRSLARTLAVTHTTVGGLQAPPGLADLHRVLAERIDDADLMLVLGWVSDDMPRRYGASAAAERAQEVQARLRIGDDV
jgi:hypothetical protein